MSKPILYLLTISHYCEKAKWALNYLEIDFDIQVLAPGSHRKVATRLGLERASLPILDIAGVPIQGSDKIISWAEQNSQSARTLGSENDEVIAVEQRLDETIGVHLRRWFYSEAILETPELVKPVFVHDLSAWEKFKLNLTWPVIRKLMTQKMDLGYQQGIDSLNIVKSEITWLESLINNENDFLVGNTFSRADVTAASLLAPLVQPAKNISATLITLPPRVLLETAKMQDCLFWRWVETQYTANRDPETV